MKPFAALLLILVTAFGCNQGADPVPLKKTRLSPEIRGKWIAESVQIDGFKWLDMPADQKLQCCCALLNQTELDEKAGAALSQALDDYYADPLRRKVPVSEAELKLHY